jgi:hypothetical protein
MTCCHNERVTEQEASLSKPLTLLVGAAGFEPAAPCSQSRCSTRLSYAPTRWISKFYAAAAFRLVSVVSRILPAPRQLRACSTCGLRLEDEQGCRGSADALPWRSPADPRQSSCGSFTPRSSGRSWAATAAF